MSPALEEVGARVRSQAEFLLEMVLPLPNLTDSQHYPIRVPPLTLRRSRLCPYSSRMVVPLCITPFPVIIQVPAGTEWQKMKNKEESRTLEQLLPWALNRPALPGISPERKLVIVEGNWR